MSLVSRVGNELLKKYFPKSAQFFQELNEFWRNKTRGVVNMEFGSFYTMAINLPMVHEVKAIPHVDGMNVAFGPCALMPFGEPASIIIIICIIAHSYISGFFPSDVRAWFVNHSLRLIFQVPTAVWTYTLSTLVIHYNADIQGI